MLYSYKDIARIITDVGSPMTKAVLHEYMIRYGLKDEIKPAIGEGIPGQTRYFTEQNMLTIALLLLQKRGFEITKELKNDIRKAAEQA